MCAKISIQLGLFHVSVSLERCYIYMLIQQEPERAELE